MYQEQEESGLYGEDDLEREEDEFPDELASFDDDDPAEESLNDDEVRSLGGLEEANFNLVDEEQLLVSGSGSEVRPLAEKASIQSLVVFGGVAALLALGWLVWIALSSGGQVQQAQETDPTATVSPANNEASEMRGRVAFADQQRVTNPPPQMVKRTAPLVGNEPPSNKPSSPAKPKSTPAKKLEAVSPPQTVSPPPPPPRSVSEPPEPTRTSRTVTPPPPTVASPPSPDRIKSATGSVPSTTQKSRSTPPPPSLPSVVPGATAAPVPVRATPLTPPSPPSTPVDPVEAWNQAANLGQVRTQLQEELATTSPGSNSPSQVSAIPSSEALANGSRPEEIQPALGQPNPLLLRYANALAPESQIPPSALTPPTTTAQTPQTPQIQTITIGMVPNQTSPGEEAILNSSPQSEPQPAEAPTTPEPEVPPTPSGQVVPVAFPPSTAAPTSLATATTNSLDQEKQTDKTQVDEALLKTKRSLESSTSAAAPESSPVVQLPPEPTAPPEPSLRQVQLGTSARARAIVPLFWSTANKEPPSARFAVELLEDVRATDGAVALPKGTVLVAQLQAADPQNLLVNSSAIAIVYPNSNGQILQQEITQGNIVIRGADNGPLIAKSTPDIGGDVARQDILIGLLGGAGKAGEILNQPVEEEEIDDGFGRTRRRTRRSDPNIAGAVLQGFFQPTTERLQERADLATKEAFSAAKVAIVPTGTEVSVFFNSFVQIYR
jgi:hypothetical protein